MVDDRLREEHRELRKLSEALAAAIAACDSNEVSALRWRLFRILLTHLAREETTVYARMIGQGGRARALATAYQDEMGGLGDDLRRHFAAWPIARVAADWIGFAADARRLLGALARRIDREDAHLYPLADRIASRSAA